MDGTPMGVLSLNLSSERKNYDQTIVYPGAIRVLDAARH